MSRGCTSIATTDHEGEVRRYLQGWLCWAHSPAARAGHKQPLVPDPARTMDGLAAKARQDQADAAAAMTPIAARDAALDQVEQGTEAAWKEAARQAIWHVATTRKDFTTDDVWARLEEMGVPKTKEPRQLGPIMMRALRAGAIRDTGAMMHSRRRHHTKITVYERTPK